MLLYLTFWFPNIYRARANALFMIAMPITSAVASVLSGYILSLDGTLGLKGWQWLFLVEGLPSVILGFIVFYYLDDTPEKATWLKAEEKRYLTQTLVAEHKADPVLEPGQQKKSLLSELTSATVIKFGVAYFCLVNTLAMVAVWTPLIVKSFSADASNITIGLLAAIPQVCTIIGMIWWGRRSDRKQERKWHIVWPMLFSAAGWLLTAFSGNPGHPVAGHLPRLDRLLHGHVGILDDPGSRPQFPGEGGWHRGDQRHRQHRIRPEPGGRGMVEGSHPELHDRPALRGRAAGHRGLCGSDAANPVIAKASLK